MQRQLRFCFILLSFCGLLWLPLGAAYLSEVPTSITQPDGSIVSCFASGDEYHNWLHDKDGYTIVKDPDSGWYAYAISGGQKITPGAQIAGRDNPASANIQPGINLDVAEYRKLRNSRYQAPDGRTAPSTGTINNLVVFIRFSDQTEFDQTFNSYSSWFNTGAASLKNYYREVSFNQLTINSTFYPSPSNGYVVSWQDSHPRSYYCEFSGYQTEAERREREFTLMENAIAGISSLVPANLVLDSDNDGKVDNVVFVIRGAFEDDILWPHQWSIYDRVVTLRGKRVYDYNVQIQGHLAAFNVGVICHEFFHSLGAPDLYHYHNNSVPVGVWDLMAGTTNPPQHMSAFMKWKYGHWIAAPGVISGYGIYSLNPPSSPTQCFYRVNSVFSSTEYYIIEYRKKTGLFESSIPGSGLLVYRIDSSVSWGNAEGPPDEVYLYRPDGTVSAEGDIDEAFFSLESGRTAINATTNPIPFLTNGFSGGLSLFNIGSAGETISFYHGTPTPPQIHWNPSSISASINENSSSAQTLNITNLGDVTLNYYCSLPTVTTTVLNESFTTSVRPTGWTEQQVSGDPLSWSFTNGGYMSHPPAAYDGSYNARLFIASHDASVTKLITPPLNLSEAISASLSFYHTQGDYMNMDYLKVYYKTSSGGAWVLLADYTEQNLIWTQETIPLPNITGTYYVAFEGSARYGYGVCLDKVVVTKISYTTTPWVSVNGQTAVTGSLTGFGASAGVNVSINSAGLTPGDYLSQITISSNSVNNSTVQIPINLTVLAPQPQIALSTVSISFGTVMINTIPSQTFQISNPGAALLSGNLSTTAGYIVLATTGREETSPDIFMDVFQAAVPGRNSTAFSVPAGATNSYSVYFNPTAVQAYSGTLTISHNAGGGNRTISLSGQGGKPNLGLSSTVFSADMEPSQTSTQTLIVTNGGNLPLNYSLTITNAPVWLQINNLTQLSSTIAVGGAAQSVVLSFNNTGLNPGTYTASLAGSSNDPSNTVFSINVSMIVRGTLGIYNPVGGEIWEFGSLHPIVFSYTGNQSTVLFLYSTNGGTSWISQGTRPVVQGNNSFDWTVPSTPSVNCKVRLVENVSPYYKISSNTFSIIDSAPPSPPQNLTLGRHPVIPGLVLSWQASTGYPSFYRVYFCAESNGRFSLLSTVEAPQTCYIDSSASSRARGFYRVEAVRE